MQGLSKSAKKNLARRVGAFVQQYRRKAQKGVEPNDRRYDTEVERIIQRLRPEDLDMLLNGDPDEEPNESTR